MSLSNSAEKQCTAGHATCDNVIRRMRIECWIIRNTDTHSEYAIPLAFARHERISTLNLYVNCLSCVQPPCIEQWLLRKMFLQGRIENSTFVLLCKNPTIWRTVRVSKQVLSRSYSPHISINVSLSASHSAHNSPAK